MRQFIAASLIALVAVFSAPLLGASTGPSSAGALGGAAKAETRAGGLVHAAHFRRGLRGRGFRGNRFGVRRGFRAGRFGVRRGFRANRFGVRRGFRANRFGVRRGFRAGRFRARRGFR